MNTWLGHRREGRHTQWTRSPTSTAPGRAGMRIGGNFRRLDKREQVALPDSMDRHAPINQKRVANHSDDWSIHSPRPRLGAKLRVFNSDRLIAWPGRAVDEFGLRAASGCTPGRAYVLSPVRARHNRCSAPGRRYDADVRGHDPPALGHANPGLHLPPGFSSGAIAREQGGGRRHVAAESRDDGALQIACEACRRTPGAKAAISSKP